MTRTLAALTLTVATVAHAAVPATQPPAPAPATPAAGAATSAVEPQGFAYRPEGRRDPFVSLLLRGSDTPRANDTARPAGLPGLAVSDVVLKGTLQSRDGWIGMLRGADGRTYTVRPGDRLLDGTIRRISADEVVILQQVNDPLAPTQREVRKGLRQTEEAN